MGAQNSFDITGDQRALDEDIRDYIRAETGSTAVYGLGKILRIGGAVAGGPRIAGFMEQHDEREWYLRLDAASPFLWETEPVPDDPAERVSFVLAMGLGNGSPLPQPSGRWDVYVNDRFAVSIRVAKHSQLWRGPEASLAFAANRIESAPPFGSLCLSSHLTEESFAAFGPALLTVPTEWLAPGKPATIRVEAKCHAPSTRWLLLSSVPNVLFQSDVYRAIDLLTERGRPKVGDYSLYFGDIHTHSGQMNDACDNSGCGLGSRADNYEYARGPGALDFYALTDHEWQIW